MAVKKQTKSTKAKPKAKAAKPTKKAVKKTTKKTAPKAAAKPAAKPAAPKAVKKSHKQISLPKSLLKKYEKRLLEEKEKILKALDFDKDQFNDLMHNDHEIGDIVDKAFNQYEKDRAIDISEKEKNNLKLINAALLRIKNNTYGICIRSGKPIEPKRLDAIPWTQVSIEYANKSD